MQRLDGVLYLIESQLMETVNMVIGPETSGGLDSEHTTPTADQSANTQRGNTSKTYTGVAAILPTPESRGKVVDYGAGKGENTQYIVGTETIQHEPFPQGWTPDTTSNLQILSKHAGTVDTLVSNLVYNVIREPSDRVDFWKTISKLLKPEGKAFIVSRSPSQVEASKGKKADSDGWIMNAGKPTQTWQRGYKSADLKSLAEMILGNEFKVEVGRFAKSGNGQIVITKL